jgi:hypothetical protein
MKNASLETLEDARNASSAPPRLLDVFKLPSVTDYTLLSDSRFMGASLLTAWLCLLLF